MHMGTFLEAISSVFEAPQARSHEHEEENDLGTCGVLRIVPCGANHVQLSWELSFCRSLKQRTISTCVTGIY